jgi:hypothetical protein
MARIATRTVALLVVLGGMLGLARPSTASEWWCWDDPVLVINGQVVHVLAGVPAEARTRVTQAEVVITVPNGVDAKLTAVNAPFFPLTARLERAGTVAADGSISVTATLVISGSDRFDVGLRMVQPSGDEVAAFNTANQPVRATITLVPKASRSQAPAKQPRR